MLRKEQVFFHAFSGDLFIPLCLIARVPMQGRSKAGAMAEREEDKPSSRSCFLGAKLLNKLECRRIKPQLIQQKQKTATTLNCWYSCMMLAVPKQKLMGKPPPHQFL